MVNLYGFTPFLTAGMFYKIFNEKLKITHLIGMILMTICVIIIYFS